MESKILFTGTSSGKTSLTRFHSSFLICTTGGIHLVDCGDGISKALLTQNIDVTTIDSIIISHLHADHYCGLPLLLTQMKMKKRIRELSIYAYEGEIENVIRFIKSTYLFTDRLPFTVNFRGFNVDNEFAPDSDLRVISRPNTHLEKYRCEVTEANLSFYCSSFLFVTGGKKIHYTGDIGRAEDLKLFTDYSPDLIISEFAHISPEDIITFAETFHGKIYLTHYDDDIVSLLQDQPNLLNNKAAPISFVTDGDEIPL